MTAKLSNLIHNNLRITVYERQKQKLEWKFGSSPNHIEVTSTTETDNEEGVATNDSAKWNWEVVCRYNEKSKICKEQLSSIVSWHFQYFNKYSIYIIIFLFNSYLLFFWVYYYYSKEFIIRSIRKKSFITISIH